MEPDKIVFNYGHRGAAKRIKVRARSDNRHPTNGLPGPSSTASTTSQYPNRVPPPAPQLSALNDHRMSPDRYSPGADSRSTDSRRYDRNRPEKYREDSPNSQRPTSLSRMNVHIPRPPPPPRIHGGVNDRSSLSPTDLIRDPRLIPRRNESSENREPPIPISSNRNTFPVQPPPRKSTDATEKTFQVPLPSGPLPAPSTLLSLHSDSPDSPGEKDDDDNDDAQSSVTVLVSSKRNGAGGSSSSKYVDPRTKPTKDMAKPVDNNFRTPRASPQLPANESTDSFNSPASPDNDDAASCRTVDTLATIPPTLCKLSGAGDGSSSKTPSHLAPAGQLKSPVKESSKESNRMRRLSGESTASTIIVQTRPKKDPDWENKLKNTVKSSLLTFQPKLRAAVSKTPSSSTMPANVSDKMEINSEVEKSTEAPMDEQKPQEKRVKLSSNGSDISCKSKTSGIVSKENENRPKLTNATENDDTISKVNSAESDLEIVSDGDMGDDNLSEPLRKKRKLLTSPSKPSSASKDQVMELIDESRRPEKITLEKNKPQRLKINIAPGSSFASPKATSTAQIVHAKQQPSEEIIIDLTDDDTPPPPIRQQQQSTQEQAPKQPTIQSKVDAPGRIKNELMETEQQQQEAFESSTTQNAKESTKSSSTSQDKTLVRQSSVSSTLSETKESKDTREINGSSKSRRVSGNSDKSEKSMNKGYVSKTDKSVTKEKETTVHNSKPIEPPKHRKGPSSSSSSSSGTATSKNTTLLTDVSLPANSTDNSKRLSTESNVNKGSNESSIKVNITSRRESSSSTESADKTNSSKMKKPEKRDNKDDSHDSNKKTITTTPNVQNSDKISCGDKSKELKNKEGSGDKNVICSIEKTRPNKLPDLNTNKIMSEKDSSKQSLEKVSNSKTSVAVSQESVSKKISSNEPPPPSSSSSSTSLKGSESPKVVLSSNSINSMSKDTSTRQIVSNGASSNGNSTLNSTKSSSSSSSNLNKDSDITKPGEKTCKLVSKDVSNPIAILTMSNNKLNTTSAINTAAISNESNVKNQPILLKSPSKDSQSNKIASIKIASTMNSVAVSEKLPAGPTNSSREKSNVPASTLKTGTSSNSNKLIESEKSGANSELCVTKQGEKSSINVDNVSKSASSNTVNKESTAVTTTTSNKVREHDKGDPNNLTKVTKSTATTTTTSSTESSNNNNSEINAKNIEKAQHTKTVHVPSSSAIPPADIGTHEKSAANKDTEKEITANTMPAIGITVSENGTSNSEIIEPVQPPYQPSTEKASVLNEHETSKERDHHTLSCPEPMDISSSSSTTHTIPVAIATTSATTTSTTSAAATVNSQTLDYPVLSIPESSRIGESSTTDPELRVEVTDDSEMEDCHKYPEEEIIKIRADLFDVSYSELSPEESERKKLESDVNAIYSSLSDNLTRHIDDIKKEIKQDMSTADLNALEQKMKKLKDLTDAQYRDLDEAMVKIAVLKQENEEETEARVDPNEERKKLTVDQMSEYFVALVVAETAQTSTKSTQNFSALETLKFMQHRICRILSHDMKTRESTAIVTIDNMNQHFYKTFPTRPIPWNQDHVTRALDKCRLFKGDLNPKGVELDQQIGGVGFLKKITVIIQSIKRRDAEAENQARREEAARIESSTQRENVMTPTIATALQGASGTFGRHSPITPPSPGISRPQLMTQQITYHSAPSNVNISNTNIPDRQNIVWPQVEQVQRQVVQSNAYHTSSSIHHQQQPLQQQQQQRVSYQQQQQINQSQNIQQQQQQTQQHVQTQIQTQHSQSQHNAQLLHQTRQSNTVYPGQLVHGNQPHQLQYVQTNQAQHLLRSQQQPAGLTQQQQLQRQQQIQQQQQIQRQQQQLLQQEQQQRLQQQQPLNLQRQQQARNLSANLRQLNQPHIRQYQQQLQQQQQQQQSHRGLGAMQQQDIGATNDYNIQRESVVNTQLTRPVSASNVITASSNISRRSSGGSSA